MLPDGIWVGMGGNMAGTGPALRSAVAVLSEWCGGLRGLSGLYRTAPRDVVDQPDFLNAVIHLPLPEEETAHGFLGRLLDLEQRLGRQRVGAIPKGPRLIDLDLLLFGAQLIAEPELTVPHPAMRVRRFVLDPLLEIDPDLQEPGSCVGYRAYQAACADQTIYSKVSDWYTV